MLLREALQQGRCQRTVHDEVGVILLSLRV